MSVRGSVIAATETSERLGGGGAIAAGGQLTFADGGILGNAQVGLAALLPGTIVRVEDTEISETFGDVRLGGGYGIQASVGANVTARRCLLAGNTASGVVADGDGTQVDLVDAEIRDTRANEDGTGGRGISAEAGATVSVAGCSIMGNHQAGVWAIDPGTRVMLAETAISDTAPNRAPGQGYGVQVANGAVLSANACRLSRNTEVGVEAAGVGTTVTLADTDIWDTNARAVGDHGRGIDAQAGASVTVVRGSIGRNYEAGVAAGGLGTTVDLTDTQVVDTRRSSATALALGVQAHTGAAIRITGGAVSRTAGMGVFVTNAVGELDRVVVRGNSFSGVTLISGALSIENCAINENVRDREWGGGMGVYAEEIVGLPLELSLADSTIGPHAYAAIWLDGAGRYDIEGNDLSGSEGITLSGRRAHGNAIFAQNGAAVWDGASGLLLRRNMFSDAENIAVLLHDASAAFDSNRWENNAVDLRQQRCGEDISLVTDEDLAGVPTVVESCPNGPQTIIDESLQFTSLYLSEADPL